MAILYGSRDNNPFRIPSRNARYYLLVNSETGETVVKTTEGTTLIPGLIGGESADRTVGTFYVRGPNAGKFIPESDALNEEKEYLSSVDGQKAVKNQAVITAQRGGSTNAQQLIFPNSASTPPQQPDQGGNPPPAPTLPPPGQAGPGQSGTDLNQKTTEEGVGLKPVNNGRFQYPLNMDAKQDKIKFIACEISRDNLSSTILGFKFPGPTYKKVGTPVYLAIQAPISDQNSVDWGPDSVNAIDSAIFNLSLEAMTANSNDQLADIVKTKTGEIFTKARQSSDILRKFLAGQAASLNNVLARTDGLVLNPNLELLFQGPQLRPFTFQFKMSARNKDEAKEIKNIIKYFKYYMAVRKTDDELFLKSPCVFTIQYLKGEDPHKSINLISPGDEKKACALTNCSVDYTPLGTYMTYNDQSDPESTMVAYTLSLQFQELEPIYNTDYRDFAKDHSIGF